MTESSKEATKRGSCSFAYLFHNIQRLYYFFQLERTTVVRFLMFCSTWTRVGTWAQPPSVFMCSLQVSLGAVFLYRNDLFISTTCSLIFPCVAKCMRSNDVYHRSHTMNSNFAFPVAHWSCLELTAVPSACIMQLPEDSSFYQLLSWLSVVPAKWLPSLLDTLIAFVTCFASAEILTNFSQTRDKLTLYIGRCVH